MARPSCKIGESAHPQTFRMDTFPAGPITPLVGFLRKPCCSGLEERQQGRPACEILMRITSLQSQRLSAALLRQTKTGGYIYPHSSGKHHSAMDFESNVVTPASLVWPGSGGFSAREAGLRFLLNLRLHRLRSCKRVGSLPRV
jgi:hypothetical protein